MTTLQKQLFELQDLKYRDFHAKLLPGIDKETIIDPSKIRKRLRKKCKERRIPARTSPCVL